jgi:hypothetical protein
MTTAMPQSNKPPINRLSKIFLNGGLPKLISSAHISAQYGKTAAGLL